MTWQDPAGGPAPGEPGEDATRTDWDLHALDAGIGTGPAADGVPPAAVPPAAVPQPAAAAPPPAPGLPPAAVPPQVPGPPATPPPGYGQPGPYGSPGAYGQSSGSGSGYGAPGGYPPPGGIWAPPPTYGGGMGVPGAGGLEYAGVGARFVAWLLDVVILGLIGFAISVMLSLLILGTASWTAGFASGVGQSGRFFDEGFYARAVGVAVVASVFSTLIDLAYFVLLWSSGARATLGMRVVGLQIGNAADGRTLDRGQGVKRWLAMGSWLAVVSALPILGGLVGLVQLVWYLVLLITTGTNPRRQGLHDQFAGTAVVRKAGTSSNGVVIGCVVLLVLMVVAIPLISIIALIFLGAQVSNILSDVGSSI